MILYGTSANPVPEGAISGEIIAADGVRLRTAHWMSQGGMPCKGTVALLHGRCEFIEKHFEVVRELRARGFAVATLDWRGQGGSQRLLSHPLKGHVGSFTDYQLDLDAFAREVLALCPPPHFALTHSMGGLVLLKSMLDGHRRFERMVLETPMLGLEVVPFQMVTRALVALLVRVGFASVVPPGARLLPVTDIPFACNFSTSDPERYARIADVVRAHPGLGLGPPTLGWVHAAFTAMAELARPDAISRIRQPLLLVAGEDDRLVSNAAIRRFAALCGNGNLVMIPGARHEILTERDAIRARFWAAFDAFVPSPGAA